MNSTVQQVHREFPDYEPESGYEAALSLYRIRVEAKVLRKHSLSVMARFVLRVIALGNSSPPGIAHVLGLDEIDVAVIGSELLKTSLVVQDVPGLDGRRTLILTEQGKRHIQEERQLLVPKKKTLHAHWDPLTRELKPLERDNIISLDEVRKLGIFVIPTRGQPPTLGDIELQVLRETVAMDARQTQDFEIVSLLKLQQPYIEYVRGIDIVNLRHRQSKEAHLTVFRGPRYLAAESEALQQLRAAGVRTEPGDAPVAQTEEVDLTHYLPQPVVEAAAEVRRRDLELHHIEHEIARQEIARSSTKDDEERAALEERLRRLTEELEGAQRERDRLRAEMQAATHAAVDIVRTEEHRQLLEQALREAQDEVVIISPWMNRRAVDDELCSLIDQSIRRGVRIRIGYGYAFERDGAEAERSRNNARSVIEKIKNYTKYRSGPKLEFVDIQGTHEKILICDRKFGITTSFNWLSYRGEVDDQFRRETGVMISDPLGLEKLAERALEVFRLGRA